MKKNLLGLLIIALAIGLTACSQEGYVKLAEKMGKMSENVYGIEANMSDVHNATGTVDSTVEITVGEDGKTSAVLKLDNAAQIMADVAKVKNSGQKTEALKTALSEPVVDPNDENAAAKMEAVKTALTEQKDGLASKIAGIDTSGLGESQKELLKSVQDTIASIQISENPTKAELTTVAVLSEMANVAAEIATTAEEEQGKYMNEEGLLTDEGKKVANTALGSLDTLKVVSEFAGMTLLEGVDITSLMGMGGDEEEESKDLSPKAQKILSSFSKPVAEIVKFITDAESKAFSDARYYSLVAQSKAIKTTYELLATLYSRPANIEQVDDDIIFKARDGKLVIEHGLTTNDLLRYFIATTFVEINREENGMDNLKAFVNAEGNYDGLMDIGLYYENLKNRSVLSDIWKTVRTALKKGDAAALKSAATMAVIMVDSEYTDILRLSSSNENGSMSYFVNNLGKNEEEN